MTGMDLPVTMDLSTALLPSTTTRQREPSRLDVHAKISHERGELNILFRAVFADPAGDFRR